MRIIDIRSKTINEEELEAVQRRRFHLDIQEIKREELKKLPAYELEIGKKEKSKWLKGIKQVSFSFTAQFLLKHYRIKSSFILSCLLIFTLVSGAGGIGSLLRVKDQLFEAGNYALANISPQSIFTASFAVKETNKKLSALGAIPELLSEKAQLLNLGSAWAEFFLRVSGYYNPRYYLILFQNSSEMRATGGFIGSYALIAVDAGSVEIKKIEGIYHVSGQQRILVVPPEPLQKISESWQLHDANWFFDFPTSAKTIAWLYEKSGGPTVDGIIAITPDVVERFLALTGPLYLGAFDATIDTENFMDILQYEVEVAYRPRGLEDPKEIIAHLSSLLTERLLEFPKETLASLFLSSLEKKEMLFYFARNEEQAFMNYHNWAGAIHSGEGDYLAVVNSNINGFKTDRMIEQKVEHMSHILDDGRIIDTVTITRKHRGGNEAYEWYNKVNADFLRVYVPKGSFLLEASGGTLEFHDPPLDYQSRSFHEYPLVKKITEQTVIDEKTGTRIFEENGKTVFGNWVYVSPGEEVKVAYTYQLPFGVKKEEASTSLLLTVQKQPGITYPFARIVKTPDTWQPVKQFPREARAHTLLESDRIYADVFSYQ